MTQTTRTRPAWLARHLVALWFVLFLACAFNHAQAGTSAVSAEAGVLSSLLQGTPCHAQDAPGGAPGEVCNALPHAPLTLLLLLLGLAVLLGPTAAFGLLSPAISRVAIPPPRPRLTPGLPAPIRKQLHRYNE